jgi:N,N-dimethylformamidase beta subunit-like protein/concanavalin A-like lectin/glucanase superfamily protein
MTAVKQTAIRGYADRLSVAPGETIEFKVSSARTGTYRADVVRLINGDSNPAGPGFTEVVEATINDAYPARFQPTDPGSYVLIDDQGQLAVDGPFTLHAFVYPTTPGKDDQIVFGRYLPETHSGYALGIRNGRFCLVIGDGTRTSVVEGGSPLRHSCWYSVAASFDPAARSVRLSVRSVANSVNSLLSPIVAISGEGDTVTTLTAEIADSGGPFVIGGCPVSATATAIDSHFNGKIDSPKVWQRLLSLAELDGITRGGSVAQDGLMAAWDFAEGIGPDGIPTDRVGDRGPRGLTGTCVNFPARAVTGWNWRGIEENFTHAPEQYGAIHFHDDDLVDAGWPEIAALRLPDDLPSGVYAARLRGTTRDGEETDHVPVIMRPAPGARRARIAFLLPTFTYLAYANERLQHRLDYEAAGITDHPIAAGAHDRALADHPEFGSSLYDLHADGSGVCYSSALRPILNLRPDYRMWLQNAPRGLSADLYLEHFLAHHGIEHDVLTDHDLHADGEEALEGYQVVLTGSHPEYYSARMLDALQHHVDTGRCLMYLGGNGFYWVTSQDLGRPHVVEVRRSAGIRTWEIQPGEGRHSTTGERGGLWRWRGRSPNRLVGVGMCSQGWDEKAPPFERTPLSYKPEWAWVFDGIDDHLIGDFGLVMNGASGDELDRFDEALGSPPNTAVLATSRRHSDYYQLAVEDVMMLAPGLGGATSDLVRSDMVVVERPSGGAVFSVGSICFTGSLPWQGYRNNVARLVRNVLANFLARGSTPLQVTEGEFP